jgi:hypothetical protein
LSQVRRSRGGIAREMMPKSFADLVADRAEVLRL